MGRGAFAVKNEGRSTKIDMKQHLKNFGDLPPVASAIAIATSAVVALLLRGKNMQLQDELDDCELDLEECKDDVVAARTELKTLEQKLENVAAERRELEEAIVKATRDFEDYRKLSQDTLEAMRIAEMTEKWDAMRASSSGRSGAAPGLASKGGVGGEGGGGDVSGSKSTAGTQAPPPAAGDKTVKSRSLWLTYDSDLSEADVYNTIADGGVGLEHLNGEQRVSAMSDEPERRDWRNGSDEGTGALFRTLSGRSVATDMIKYMDKIS